MDSPTRPQPTTLAATETFNSTLTDRQYETHLMTRPDSDRNLLEATWQLYDEQFSDHVGDVVTPEDHVDTEDHVDWGAQVFMFGYALGSVAGAHATARDSVDRDTDEERVTDIVDTVVEIAGSNEFAVSSDSVKADFRED